MTYQEKLRDPRWQRKRLEIMERDNWTCQHCDETTKTLNVHHKKYNGNPWDIEDDDVITLCDDCHEIEHDRLLGGEYSGELYTEEDWDRDLAKEKEGVDYGKN